MGFVRRVITGALDLANLSKHNDNFADIEADLTDHDGRITTAQGDITAHKASEVAHAAEHITYSGAVAEATTVKEAVDSVKTELSQAIIAGDSGPEAAAARASVSGETYPTLGDRLNAEYAGVNVQLAEKAEQSNVDAALALKTDKTYTDAQLTLKADQSAVEITLAPKADRTYVDQQIAAVGSASPKGAYATLSALQSAIPGGDSNIYVVVADGNWYYWNGLGQWTAGGLYQSTGIAPGSIAKDRLAFVPTEAVVSKNLFNKATVTTGKYVAYQNGGLADNAATSASDWIAVLPNTAYVKMTTGQMAFYDSNKVYISGLASATTSTTPANAAYTRITVDNTKLDLEQLELGAVSTSYESFSPKLNLAQIKDKSVSDSKLAFLPVKAASSINLFDKSAVITGKYIAYQNGTESINASFAASDWIPVSPNTQYVKVTSDQLAFYKSDKTYISGLASSSSFTTPANAAYVRITVALTKLDTEQLELGSVSTTYESFVPKLNLEQVKDKSIPDAKLTFIPAHAKASKNLFDKAAITAGRYVNYSTGALATNANFAASDYIPVTAGVQYTKVTDQQLAFYNKDKVYISGLASATTFTAPAGAAFVRITVPNDKLDAEQLEVGAAKSSYVPYGKVVDDSYLPAPVRNAIGLDDFKIELPDTIYLVSGESFSIYYYNVIKGSQRFRKGNYYITHILQGAADTVKKGVGYPYKWEYTPTLAETFTMEFAIYETYTGYKACSKLVNFVVADSTLAANHGRSANVVTIGDSFTDAFGVSGFLHDFLIGNGGGNNVNMIGTRATSVPGAMDDAISGFGYKSFYGSASGIAGTNAFYNPSTSKFDFAYYMAQNFPAYVPSGQAGQHIDAFLSILGLNDAIWKDFSTTEYAAYVQYIIDSVHAWDPAIKILLSTVTPQGIDDFYTSGDGGYPNSGVSSERSKLLQEKWNEMILGFQNPGNNVYVLPTNAHFDTRFSTNTMTVNPDKFNPSYTETVTYDIHPNSTGAKYIADAYYQAMYNLVLHA